MKLVKEFKFKEFKFKELPKSYGEDLFTMAGELMGRGGIDYGSFKYEIGFMVSEYEELGDNSGINIDYERELLDWFVDHGCEKGEKIYLSWY